MNHRLFCVNFQFHTSTFKEKCKRKAVTSLCIALIATQHPRFCSIYTVDIVPQQIAIWLIEAS